MRLRSAWTIALALLALLPGPLLSAPSPAPSPAPVNTLNQGLVAWWPGDGNTIDRAGHHASNLLGGVTYAPALGQKGFLFDGRSGGIFVPDFDDLKLVDSFSITVWAELDSLSPAPGEIFFRGDNRLGTDPYALVILPAEKDHTDVQFLIDSGNGSQAIQARFPVKKLTHIAATLNSATDEMRLYLDGKLVAHTTTRIRPFKALDPNQDPGIGIGNTQDPLVYNQPFHGLLADLRIYHRALSPAEVQALYEQGRRAAQASAGKSPRTLGR